MKRIHLVLAILALLPAILFAAGSREEGSFTYTDVTAIEVDAGTFDVTIQPTSSDVMAMEVRNEPQNYRVYHDVRGDRVVVWVERSFSLFGGFHSGDLLFRVPVTAEIDIETSTGDVVASGLSGDSLRMRTSTGSIQLRDVETDVELQTSTGSVTVESSRGEFDVRTSTGSIVLVEITGPVDTESSTGSQSFRSISGDIDAKTTTGRIEFETTVGSIQSESSTGRQSGVGVQLTEDSRFESTTGSIEIDIEQDLTELEFDLRSTTGSLSVGSEESQRRLFLGSSGIRVEGETSTGSQRYY
jgi:hypothetical protein